MSEIAREAGPGGGRYVLRGPEGEAELTWRDAGPGRVSADHTYVPDAMRGQGIAARLAERLAADAEAEGFRILPRCSYVEAWRRRHPERAALFA